VIKYLRDHSLQQQLINNAIISGEKVSLIASVWLFDLEEVQEKLRQKISNPPAEGESWCNHLRPILECDFIEDKSFIESSLLKLKSIEMIPELLEIIPKISQKYQKILYRLGFTVFLKSNIHLGDLKNLRPKIADTIKRLYESVKGDPNEPILRDEDGEDCYICSGKANMMRSQCFHCFICSDCLRLSKKSFNLCRSKCPVCRSEIDGKLFEIGPVVKDDD